MEYVLNMLNVALLEELRQEVISEQALQGNGFRYRKETMEAFRVSGDLAKERIPQLKKAIECIKSLETPNKNEIKA